MERTCRILVVEDEKAHAQLIRRAFAPHADRYELAFASTLEAARGHLEGQRPDLVICDMLLPDGQGTDLLPKDESPAFPLVLMTSFGNENVAVGAIKAGAVDYVVKTVETLDDLPRTAERALREWAHIAERRRAEEDLQRANAIQSAILDNSMVGICLVKNRCFERVNARMAEIAGMDPEGMKGVSTRIVYSSDEEFDRIGRTAYPVLGRGERFEDEIRARRADGSAFWARIMGRVLDPGRPQEGSIWVFEDITARKETEEALKAHQERLEDLVALRTTELQGANARLQELNEQKNYFFGVVGHDLRNPLNSMVLGAQLIEEESDQPEVRAMAARIHREGMEMSILIGHFLDIAAIESGKLKAELTRFSLRAMVEQVVDTHVARAREKGIALRLAPFEGRGEVLADTRFMKEILYNLISNAIKFSPPGTTVTVRVEEGGGKAVVSVEDKGPGLTQEDRRRLFGRYARLSAQPTGGEKSVGLGLSIVKYMVDAMGGRIWVDSEPGAGAAFRVEVPTGS